MSGTAQSAPPAAQPPRQSILRGILWPIAIFAMVVLYTQRPAIKELYYRLSGTEPPQSTIPWREDFQTALAEVGSSEKPMLLVFSATWCGPCNNMKRDVWADPEVGDSVTAGFVPVHIDVDDAQQGAVADRFGVRTIPAIFVLGADGEILARESYMSRSEALAFLAATGHSQPASSKSELSAKESGS